MAFNYEPNTVTGIMNGSRTTAPSSSTKGAGRDAIEMVPLKKRENSHSSRRSEKENEVLPQTPLPPKPSKKILSHTSSTTTQQPPQTPKKQLQFSEPECHTVSPSPPPISIISPRIILPNRKREEEIVMANLRKKVPAFNLTRRKPAPRAKDTVDSMSSSYTNSEANSSHLDNRVTTPIPKITSRTGINLMDPNNNNSNSSYYDDASSVKASSTVGMQDKDFILELLCWHNEYRARHAVTALTISTELCEYAQTWANHLANCNEFYYRSDKSIGQNLFCCPVSALVTDLTGQEVASFWYSTVRRYNYYKESHLLHTNVNAGHFAQLIWASSRYLGVGKASSKTGKIFVVAFYFPPGNLIDAYHANVPPPMVEQDQVAGNSPKLIDADNNPIPSILKQ